MKILFNCRDQTQRCNSRLVHFESQLRASTSTGFNTCLHKVSNEHVIPNFKSISRKDLGYEGYEGYEPPAIGNFIALLVLPCFKLLDLDLLSFSVSSAVDVFKFPACYNSAK